MKKLKIVYLKVREALHACQIMFVKVRGLQISSRTRAIEMLNMSVPLGKLEGRCNFTAPSIFVETQLL